MPTIWIVIAIAATVINMISKSKKEQAKQQNAARPARTQAPEGGNAPQKRPQTPPLAQTRKPLSSAMQAKPLAAQPHKTEPLTPHMHVPEMGWEGEGTEGIDCCHEFMLDQPIAAEQPDFLPLAEQAEAERAKALLQGVIFSEILGRRPVRRYGGKHS